MEVGGSVGEDPWEFSFYKRLKKTQYIPEKNDKVELFYYKIM